MASSKRNGPLKNLNGKLCRLVEELAGRGLTLSQSAEVFERQFILAALRQSEGNVSRAARCLGVHRNTLRNKVSRLGIEPRDYSAPPRGRRRQSGTRSRRPSLARR